MHTVVVITIFSGQHGCNEATNAPNSQYTVRAAVQGIYQDFVTHLCVKGGARCVGGHGLILHCAPWVVCWGGLHVPDITTVACSRC